MSIECALDRMTAVSEHTQSFAKALVMLRPLPQLEQGLRCGSSGGCFRRPNLPVPRGHPTRPNMAACCAYTLYPYTGNIKATNNDVRLQRYVSVGR